MVPQGYRQSKAILERRVEISFLFEEHFSGKRSSGLKIGTSKHSVGRSSGSTPKTAASKVFGRACVVTGSAGNIFQASEITFEKKRGKDEEEMPPMSRRLPLFEWLSGLAGQLVTARASPPANEERQQATARPQGKLLPPPPPPLTRLHLTLGAQQSRRFASFRLSALKPLQQLGTRATCAL